MAMQKSDWTEIDLVKKDALLKIPRIFVEEMIQHIKTSLLKRQLVGQRDNWPTNYWIYDLKNR